MVVVCCVVVLLDVCWVVFGVRGSSCVVFFVRCYLLAVKLLVANCLLLKVRCSPCVVICVLRGVRCSLSVVLFSC